MMNVDQIQHLALTFESIELHDTSNSSSSLSISPLAVFKIGSILYETHKNDPTRSGNTTTFLTLSNAFHQLLRDIIVHTTSVTTSTNITAAARTSVEIGDGKSNKSNYVSNVIFYELYSAFENVLNASFYSPLQHRVNNKFDDNETNIVPFQTILSSIRALGGICHSLLVQCETATKMNGTDNNYLVPFSVFDKSFCHTLAKLYDYFIVECDFESPIHKNDTTTIRSGESSEIANIVDEVLECILDILSFLLVYGLIYPIQNTNLNISEDDKIQQIMEVIQGMIEHSSDASYCLGDLQSWQKKQQQNRQKKGDNNIKPLLVEVIQIMFTNEVQAQKEYLLSVLNSASTSQSTKQKLEKSSSSSTTTTTKDPASKHKTQNQRKQSALDRLILQVHQIVPHLGKGYIEAALACYNNNIEETTNALMEGELNPSSLHPRLRAIDKSLPERRKESKDTYDSFGSSIVKKNMMGSSVENNYTQIDKEEEEAREIQRAMIKQMVAIQEDEAYKLGVAMTMNGNDLEYNDDYDDQYDGVRDGIGGADAGLYDVDFESIKAYNKITKEMEADRLFWEENRNMNRLGGGNVKGGGGRQKQKKNEDNDIDDNGEEADEEGNDGEGNHQKKYRGPDKGKGGRIIGPDGKYLPHPKHRKKGGKGNQNKNKSTATSGNGNNLNQNNEGKEAKNQGELSKIQKRRKNDNKAKIANHHRKERALKKTGL